MPIFAQRTVPEILVLVLLNVGSVFLLLMSMQFANAQSATEDAQPTPPPKTLFEQLFQRAKESAQQAAVDDPANAKLPDSLKNMNYSQYRSIRFRPEAALWKNESLFEVQLFHLGFLYQQPIRITEIIDGNIQAPIAYSNDLFDYGEPSFLMTRDLPSNLGFSGLRLHYPLNSADYKDELVVFQGASYFRFVGRGERYGLSARGLAVDTGEPTGEEFPTFTEFWLRKPMPDERQIKVYALLSSPSVSGIYEFDINAGIPVTIDVKLRLYVQKTIKKLGIAPITSMFFFGENTESDHDDFRPEVHDSDGLQILTGESQWIWRPLTNPKHLQITSSMNDNPKGFGLLQRDRNFDHYMDAEAHYEKRPSYWIEPLSAWGSGRIELVEIPSASETNDNIVAYWVPAEKIEQGKEYQYEYRIRSTGQSVSEHKLAQVIRTRIGWAAVPGAPNPPPKSNRQFIVDFKGGTLTNLPTTLTLKPQLEASAGEITDLRAFPLPDDGIWRVSFKIDPKKSETVDMQLRLSLNGQNISEVWNYVWNSSNYQ